jgi:hypothetical protein
MAASRAEMKAGKMVEQMALMMVGLMVENLVDV